MEHGWTSDLSLRGGMLPFQSYGTAVQPDDQSYGGEHVESPSDSSLSGLGWDRDNQKSGHDGLKISLVRGECYKDTGDGKWYEWRMILTFDNKGCLKLVDAPYRVTIEEPTTCT
jgi:hypothetical protein